MSGSPGSRRDFGYEDATMQTPKTPHNHPSGHRYAPVQRPSGCLGALRWSCRRRRAKRLSGPISIEALQQTGLEPEWVFSVSISAINSVLSARQCARPAATAMIPVWKSGRRSPARTIWPYTPDSDIYRQTRNTMSSADPPAIRQATCSIPAGSIPGFLPPERQRDARSFYDNSAFKETLEELVDSKRLNDGQSIHFASGRGQLVPERRYNFVFFDQPQGRNPLIKHILANLQRLPARLSRWCRSCTDYFWDGGIVSSTPLQHLLAQGKRHQVAGVPGPDLFQRPWPARRAPSRMRLGRQKDIMCSLAHPPVTAVRARCGAGRPVPVKRWSWCPTTSVNDERAGDEGESRASAKGRHPAG